LVSGEERSVTDYECAITLCFMFLQPDELRVLTGRARPRAQIEFLRAHRIRHIVNAVGKPVVAKAWLDAGEPKDVPAIQPNFAAARRVE
jgi:hypothetical protein